MIAYVHRNTKHLFELWRLFSQVIYLMCLHGNVYLCRYIYLRVYAHEYSAAYIWHSIWYTYIHMLCVSHYYEFRAILHVHTHARAHTFMFLYFLVLVLVLIHITNIHHASLNFICLHHIAFSRSFVFHMVYGFVCANIFFSLGTNDLTQSTHGVESE